MSGNQRRLEKKLNLQNSESPEEEVTEPSVLIISRNKQSCKKKLFNR